jgi:hydrogenase nickel incorporation protein HypA/HybF
MVQDHIACRAPALSSSCAAAVRAHSTARAAEARRPVSSLGPMHELSIAIDLVAAASEKAAELGLRISVVHVRVGALSGVVAEALAFSFDVAAAGSEIEGARLAIEEVPVTVRCPRCGGEPRPASPQALRCPDCGGPASEVVSGRELELFALEGEDAPTGAPS